MLIQIPVQQAPHAWIAWCASRTRGNSPRPVAYASGRLYRRGGSLCIPEAVAEARDDRVQIAARNRRMSPRLRSMVEPGAPRRPRSDDAGQTTRRLARRAGRITAATPARATSRRSSVISRILEAARRGPRRRRARRRRRERFRAYSRPSGSVVGRGRRRVAAARAGHVPSGGQSTVRRPGGARARRRACRRISNNLREETHNFPGSAGSAARGRARPSGAKASQSRSAHLSYRSSPKCRRRGRHVRRLVGRRHRRRGASGNWPVVHPRRKPRPRIRPASRRCFRSAARDAGRAAGRAGSVGG